MARPKKLPDGMKQRGKTYYAWFTAHGQTVRKALSQNLDAATTILNDLKVRMDRKEWNQLDNDVDIEEIKKQYLEHCEQHLKERSRDRVRQSLANILPKLAVKQVSMLTPRGVIAYRQGRLEDGRSPRTINMEVQSLQTMLRWAVRYQLIGSNPLHEIKPLRHDNPKEGRALTPDEARKLVESSPLPWRDIWYAFLVTGMRKNELATLRWRDIDWEAREIIVRSSVAKNHTSRRIPIDNGLWDILVKRRGEKRQPGKGKTEKITLRVQERFTREHVFTSSENTPLTHRSAVYGAFMRCCKKAGIETRTFDEDGRELEHVDVHSLRRTFATSLITSGADPKTVQELMGHKTLAMTMNLYAKIHTSTRRQALGLLPYGQGVTSPDHVANATISMIREPEAHKMRTTNLALAAR